MSSKIIYKEGDTIGLAIYLNDVSYIRERKALFICKCGKLFTAEICKVKSKRTKSCGCLMIEYYKKRTKQRTEILCKCGCAGLLTSINKRGENAKFIHGHNRGHNKPHTDGAKELISKKRINKGTGDKNVNWKGGITPINRIIRESTPYRLWRKAVFERDNYTCQDCGEKEKVSGKLEADHIKPFAYFPELRFSIDNGRTLYKECHKKTDTYLWKCNIKYR